MEVQENNKEIWKTIIGYDGYYEVSNIGRIKSLERISGKYCHIKEKILSPSAGEYLRVRLSKEGKSKSFLVHRLVALAFVENPNPKHFNIVNHIDENKLNNVWDNLEWCTFKYNVTYGTAIERKSNSILGEKHFRFGVTLSDDHKKKLSMSNKNHEMIGNSPTARSVMCDGMIFSSIKECSDYYGVTRSLMTRWINGDRRMPDRFIHMGLIKLPKLQTKEVTMDELLSYESERGIGSLGSSGK